MKLSRALKEKNRLIGEIGQLYSILVRENSRRVDSTSKVDVNSVYTRWESKIEELVKLKAAIAVANAPNFINVSRMEELKSKIKQIDPLNTKDGKFKEIVGYSSDVAEEVVYIAFITQEKKDELKKKYQEEINNLQDIIDDFNASTDVILT